MENGAIFMNITTLTNSALINLQTTFADRDTAIKALAEQLDQQGKLHNGAAGGAPLGLSLAFNIQIQAGIDMVLDILKVNDALQGADLVITGEGQMDNQTLNGKTPFGVAKRALARDIPVIAIAGSLGTEVKALYDTNGSIFGTVRSPQQLPQVLTEAGKNLTRTARNIAATLQIDKQLHPT